MSSRSKIFGRTDSGRRAARFMGARNSDGGFSFIELLAYMAIAALLILAAIPQFNKYREQATISTMQNDARNFAVEAEAAYTLNLDYPATQTATAGGKITAPSDALAAFSGVKTSDGNVVMYTDNTSSFTVRITNPTRAGSNFVVYDSSKGGLLKTNSVN